MSESENNAEMPGGVAGELVAQGATLVRIENETMMSIAVQRPRDETKVMEGAITELEMMAKYDSAELLRTYYTIRFSDGTRVEGPSIKAAQNLARRWGNCTAGSRILSEDKDGYNLEGFFVDYETNYRITRPFRSTKWLKRRSGRVERLTQDKQLQQVQIAASKSMRNAILSALTSLLVQHYYRTSKKLAGGLETVEKMKAAFSKWDVTVEMLEAYVEAPLSSWTADHLADLRGLYNSIKDGQTTVQEIFHSKKEKPNAGPATPDPILDVAEGKEPAKAEPATVDVPPEDPKEEPKAEAETSAGKEPEPEPAKAEPDQETKSGGPTRDYYCPHGVGDHGKGCVECEAHEQS